jgi:hypothetical protein
VSWNFGGLFCVLCTELSLKFLVSSNFKEGIMKSLGITVNCSAIHMQILYLEHWA